MEEMIAYTDHEEVGIKEQLENDLADEESDVSKYMELAHLAEMHCQGYGYASILRDIAKEEMTHHEHIKAILDDMHRRGL